MLFLLPSATHLKFYILPNTNIKQWSDSSPQKWQFCNHLFTFMLFQTCMTLNDILLNVCFENEME